MGNPFKDIGFASPQSSKPSNSHFSGEGIVSLAQKLSAQTKKFRRPSTKIIWTV
jgi:hypothetical protein